MRRCESSILTELKLGTHEAHQRIERRIPLLDDNLSLTTYCAYLEIMLGFYQPFEERLAAFVYTNTDLGFDERRKTGLIERDLRYLGYTEPALAAAPRCADLPAPGDMHEALGCIYVLEGATLGGVILERHVSRVLGLSRTAGCAFLSSYGDAVGPMWRALGSVLERAATNVDTRSRMVRAASETFTKLESWLAHAPQISSMPGKPAIESRAPAVVQGATTKVMS